MADFSIKSEVLLSYNIYEKIFDDFAQGLFGLPKSDVLRFKNEDYRIIIRPSGTEPKMKIYLQAKGKNITEAQEKIEKMKSPIDGLLEY